MPVAAQCSWGGKVYIEINQNLVTLVTPSTGVTLKNVFQNNNHTLKTNVYSPDTNWNLSPDGYSDLLSKFFF
jgi:hypothetical protein